MHASGRAGLDQKREMEGVKLWGRVLRGVGHAGRIGSNRDQIRRGPVEERHHRGRNQGRASLWHCLRAVARGRAREAPLLLTPSDAVQLGTALHCLGIKRGRGNAVGESQQQQGCRDEYAENPPAKHAVLTVRAAEPCVKRAEPAGSIWSRPIVSCSTGPLHRGLIPQRTSERSPVSRSRLAQCCESDTPISIWSTGTKVLFSCPYRTSTLVLRRKWSSLSGDGRLLGGTRNELDSCPTGMT